MAICCDGDRLGPALEGLLAAVNVALEECNVPACRSFVSTAPVVPWDDCCACNDGVGQLWVSVDRVDPILTPSGGGGEVRCRTGLEANVWIGILRCAQVPDDSGNPPSPDALTQEAMEVLADRLLLTQAIYCNWEADPDTFTVRGWESLAGGGCVGGRLNLTLRFVDPRCAS